METNTKILLAILIVITLPISIPLTVIVLWLAVYAMVAVITTIVHIIQMLAMQPVYGVCVAVLTAIIMYVGYNAYRFLGRNG